jgi:hypothetical protein
MKAIIALSTLACLSSGVVAATAPSKPEVCLSTREFITSLEFLRENKDFALNEDKARELAHKVSAGCTGASKRFIQITSVLTKAGVPTKSAIETGLTMAASTDEATSAFLSVFRGAFLETLLDLDTKSALDIALELTHSFDGNRKAAQDDFNRLVDFCVNKKSLDLPVQQCGRMAARIVKSGESFDFKVSKDFIALTEYLTSSSKTNIPTFQALEVAEGVVKHGPQAKDNFIKAYEYAIAKKGFDAASKDAIEFGKTMASRSVKEKQ